LSQTHKKRPVVEYTFGNKRMKIKIQFAIFLCAVAACVGVYGSDTPAPPKADSGDAKHTIDPKKPDIVRKVAKTEWRMWYIAKGTRSEGLHGALSVDGAWLSGKTNGATAVTGLGEFVWHGDWDSRKLLFSKSGWLPSDLSSVYPSWTTNTAEPAGGAYVSPAAGDPSAHP
jgi:hypothetical protein